MSALTLKADMCGATGDVRYGPEADISPSFDNFGDLLKVHWHGQAERFCTLKIDDKFEFCRPLDRQVSRLFAFKNPCGVSAGEAIGIRLAWSVTCQMSAMGQ
jgi:hypothetical protein